jgi:hypothetical protein
MSRRKPKGRLPCKSFYWIPRRVHQSADFRQLSGNAVKLLCSLAYQFTGNNNGDMTAAWSVMRDKHGFRSPRTLNNVRNELLAANLLYVTRQGGRGRCNLYALTWMPIDECHGKLDCKPTTLAVRKEWHLTQVTEPKTKRMKDSTIVEFAERKEQMQR